MMQEAKEEFCDRWVREIFSSLFKQNKWYKYKRNVQVGNVVLRREKTAPGQSHKYAYVIKVHKGTDGMVQSANVEYKLPGESKFRVTTRPIHKLIFVVVIEE